MYGQGHLYCTSCGHAVYRRFGGCRTCGTPLAELMLLDAAMDDGLCGPGIGFDPFDGEIAIGIPGTDLAIEPETGQFDLDFGGFDVPL
jgi:hypothetical protein